MVCVKDTATLPRLTLVSRFPSVCTKANGSTAFTCGSGAVPLAMPSVAYSKHALYYMMSMQLYRAGVQLGSFMKVERPHEECQHASDEELQAFTIEGHHHARASGQHI